MQTTKFTFSWKCFRSARLAGRLREWSEKNYKTSSWLLYVWLICTTFLEKLWELHLVNDFFGGRKLSIDGCTEKRSSRRLLSHAHTFRRRLQNTKCVKLMMIVNWKPRSTESERSDKLFPKNVRDWILERASAESPELTKNLFQLTIFEFCYFFPLSKWKNLLWKTRETRDGAVYKQRSASTVFSEFKICKNC